ncbi:hypothetical protein V6N13_106279 [Hibiscus sabdariffa]
MPSAAIYIQNLHTKYSKRAAFTWSEGYDLATSLGGVLHASALIKLHADSPAEPLHTGHPSPSQSAACPWITLCGGGVVAQRVLQAALERYKYEQSLDHTSEFIEKSEKELEEYLEHKARYKKAKESEPLDFSVNVPNNGIPAMGTEKPRHPGHPATIPSMSVFARCIRKNKLDGNTIQPFHLEKLSPMVLYDLLLLFQILIFPTACTVGAQV